VTSRRSVLTLGGAATFAAALLALAATARPAFAQGGAFTPTVRHVSGQVVRGTRDRPVPVPNTWAVLHRVGPDRAGPLDSVRTRPDGSYAFSYKLSGDTSAVYFVSSSYDGVAYFTDPLRLPDVSGGDAQVTVFDTSSARGVIALAGHHLVIGAPESNGNREVGEVFDLQNDSTVTIVGTEASPVWITHLPHGLVNFQLNQNGQIPDAAVLRRGDSLSLYAPISPGLRQLAITYQLPPGVFPLDIPLERPTEVLEVLVQEPLARVSGPKLVEQADATLDGRTFRRFLAQDLPASTVLEVEVPASPDSARKAVITVLSIIAAALIIAGLVAASRTRAAPALAGASADGRLVPVAAQPLDPSEALLREIAALDIAFEQRGASASDAERASYERARAELKARLGDVLAASGGRT
jgi:hypothetical protein